MSQVVGADGSRLTRKTTRRLAFVPWTVATMVSLSFLVWLGWQIHLAGLRELRGTGLISISSAVWGFQAMTGHAPQSVDEIVAARIRVGSWPEFVLAPLDDRFWDDYLIANMGGEMLAAYCTVHFPGSDTWTYIGLWTHQYQESTPAEVLRWVADQREAITWLDESFPLADLERTAQTDSGRRGRMASAILGYRREKAEKKGP